MTPLESRIEEAEEHYRRGRLNEAAAAYDSALDLDPDHIGALEWRGEVAVQLEDYETAVDCLARARELRGDNAFSEYTNLGLSYYELNRPEEAVETLWKAIQHDPKDYVSHSNLGKALYDLHANADPAEAKRIATAWYERFPTLPDAQHIGAAISGLAKPKTANAAYVEDIFNDYAPIFDEKLIEELGYQAPDLLTARMAAYFGSDAAGLTVLDAGCGTGLCGPLLRPFAERLDGVDLSPKMLEKAEEKGCYDELQKAELVACLVRRPGRYHAVMAADVLCYFGDLEKALAGFAKALKPGGWLGFTVERWPGDEPYNLDPSGRYKHSLAYLDRIMEQAALTCLAVEEDVLRSEYGEPVHGLIVTAAKPE